jgi:hypothetical protein
VTTVDLHLKPTLSVSLCDGQHLQLSLSANLRQAVPTHCASSMTQFFVAATLVSQLLLPSRWMRDAAVPVAR